MIHQGPYSQLVIVFLTFKRPNKVVLHYTKRERRTSDKHSFNVSICKLRSNWSVVKYDPRPFLENEASKIELEMIKIFV